MAVVLHTVGRCLQLSEQRNQRDAHSRDFAGEGVGILR
jgi:hypothetical protein